MPHSTVFELNAQKESKGLHASLSKQLTDKNINMIIYPLDKIPLAVPKGIELAAVSERLFPSDSFLSIKYSRIEKVYQDSHIGVKSSLLKLLVKKNHPKLKVKEYKNLSGLALIKKLASGEIKGLILPDYELLNLKFTKPSYLTKLEKEEKETSFKFKNKRIKISPLSDDIFLPSACQGVLGIEVNANNIENMVMASKINHYDTFYAIRAERAFLYALGENMKTIPAALASIYQNQLILNVLLIDSRGNIIREKIQDRKKSCEEIGYGLAQKVKNKIAV